MQLFSYSLTFPDTLNKISNRNYRDCIWCTRNVKFLVQKEYLIKDKEILMSVNFLNSLYLILICLLT